MAVTFDPETLTVVAARGLGFSPSIPINAGMQGVTENPGGSGARGASSVAPRTAPVLSILEAT
jgi:hypothetical protein